MTPDDAVLSLGGWIAANRAPKSTMVLTVCAGVPSMRWRTEYDKRSGFQSSAHAVSARREEDRNAIATVLDQQCHWLDFLDGQYNDPINELKVAEALQPWFVDAEEIIVPLGLMHPDHITTAQACRLAATRSIIKSLLIYEDLPSAAIWPWSRRAARNIWHKRGWRMNELPIVTQLAMKRRAVKQYESQQANFDELAFKNLCEERLWVARRG